MPNNNVQTIIKDLIINHGRNIVKKDRAIQGYIEDTLSAYPAQKNISINLAKEGILKELSNKSTLSETELKSYTNQIVNRYGTDSHLTQKTIEAWAEALGIKLSKIQQTIQSQPVGFDNELSKEKRKENLEKVAISKFIELYNKQDITNNNVFISISLILMIFSFVLSYYFSEKGLALLFLPGVIFAAMIHLIYQNKVIPKISDAEKDIVIGYKKLNSVKNIYNKYDKFDIYQHNIILDKRYDNASKNYIFKAINIDDIINNIDEIENALNNNFTHSLPYWFAVFMIIGFLSPLIIYLY